MAQINDGGQAFPSVSVCDATGRIVETGDYGMTLRDWFAGQAMSGMMANSPGLDAIHAGTATAEDGMRVAAHIAYLHADAMIAARNAGKAVPNE